MADKPKLKYHIKSVYNPKTGGTLLRPIITDRSSMNLDQTVKYALNAAYVRGQYNDMRGVLNGFIEAIQQLGKDGFDVCLNNWLRVHGELTGSVGEDRQLTSENAYKVDITALTDLKRDVDEFSWTNVDDTGAIIKVDNISSPGGKVGEIIKTKAIVANGKNLVYDATWGDSVKVSYVGLETPIAITPNEQSESYLRFEWPTALADVPAGTELVFEFKLHGKAEGVEQGSIKTVTLVAAS